jgi:hypothetical protein
VTSRRVERRARVVPASPSEPHRVPFQGTLHLPKTLEVRAHHVLLPHAPPGRATLGPAVRQLFCPTRAPAEVLPYHGEDPPTPRELPIKTVCAFSYVRPRPPLPRAGPPHSHGHRRQAHPRTHSQGRPTTPAPSLGPVGARAATPCPALPCLIGVSQPQCPSPPCAAVGHRRPFLRPVWARESNLGYLQATLCPLPVDRSRWPRWIPASRAGHPLRALLRANESFQGPECKAAKQGPFCKTSILSRDLVVKLYLQ